MEDSSFETLEALAAHLAHVVLRKFHPFPTGPKAGALGWQVRVALEKPTAIPSADGAVVEMRAFD